MRAVWSICKKDLKLLFRSKGSLFYAFAFPALVAVLFGVIFSGQGGDTSSIDLAVVDEDQTDASRAFVAALDASEEIDAQLLGRAEAEARVRRGRLAAYLVIEPGFSEGRADAYQSRPARFQLGYDPRRQAEAGMLQALLRRFVLMSVAGEVPFNDPVDVTTTALTLERTAPPNAFAISFPQGILWAILGCAATFAIGIVTERTKGTLVRLRVAPIRKSQILMGKASACFIALLLIQTLLLAFGVVVFGVPVHSPVTLGVAVASVALGFTGLMMFLATLGKSEETASGVSWALVTVMAMFGGGMIPLFLMPSWMQAASHASPAKWAVLAIEGATWRGFALSDMLGPCAVLAGVGLTLFALATPLLRDE